MFDQYQQHKYSARREEQVGLQDIKIGACQEFGERDHVCRKQIANDEGNLCPNTFERTISKPQDQPQAHENWKENAVMVFPGNWRCQCCAQSHQQEVGDTRFRLLTFCFY